MSNLEALSHAISAEHASSLREEREKGGRGHSSPKPQRIPIPEVQAPASPKKEKEKESSKEIEKIKKEQEKKDQEKDKAEKIRKITQYAENENLSGFFPENLKERARKIDYKDSHEHISGIYEEFLSCLKQNHKKMFVDMMFDQLFCPASEVALVQFANMNHKRGIGTFFAMNKNHLLQPELDEIMIEMSDSYIPGPWARMAGKLASVIMSYDVTKLELLTQMQRDQAEKLVREEMEKSKNDRERESTPEPNGRGESQKKFPQKVPNRRGK